jgi:hypothetical protein
MPTRDSARLHQGVRFPEGSYTLKPALDLPHCNWIGFCDGERCGAFRTKKEFEDFVDLQPELPSIGSRFRDASRAEWESTMEGEIILNQICKKARAAV